MLIITAHYIRPSTGASFIRGSAYLHKLCIFCSHAQWAIKTLQHGRSILAVVAQCIRFVRSNPPHGRYTLKDM
jgi:hypothetical protein